MSSWRVIVGDCIAGMQTLPEQSVHCCVTSPPYFGLRDYKADGQIGLERTPEEYIARLVGVFREVRRVLRDEGTLWLNLGDSFRKDKNLLGIPWRVAFALQADGWFLRQDIIWHKPNPMPESVTDRCTRAHEYIFMLSKSARYFYDADGIKEKAVYADSGRRSATKADLSKNRKRNGSEMAASFRAIRETRNRRSVWTIATKPFAGAHFATFPPDLVEPCILAGCPVGGIVLDPFGGSGTTAGVAVRNGRDAILCELNPDYAAIMPGRVLSITGTTPDMFREAAE